MTPMDCARSGRLLSRMLTQRVAPLVILVLLALAPIGAQSGAPVAPAGDDGPWSRLKVGATTLVAVPHVGVERSLRRSRRSFQWDLLVSPWLSADGGPFTFAVATAEWRFYRSDRETGWFTAVNVGGAVFRLRRPDYRDTTLYQEGMSGMVGGSVGYVWQRRSGRTVELYVGAGSIQSLYKGYDALTDSRVDGARLWNVSGEFLPYRTGVQLGLPRRRPR